MLRTSRKSSVLHGSLPSSSVLVGGSSSNHSHKPYKNGGVSLFHRQKYVQRQSLSSILLVIMLVCALVMVAATIRHNNNSNSRSSTSFQHRLYVTQQEQQQLSTTASSSSLSTTYTADYDVIIVGAGPAGLTAGIFAARLGLDVLVTGSVASSQLAESVGLANFPSFVVAYSKDHDDDYHHKNKPEPFMAPPGGGQAWLQATQQQAAAVGVQFAAGGLMVSHIQQGGITATAAATTAASAAADLFTIILEQRYTVTARSVILATGATSRRLELPSETQLWGRALHSCVICDGPAYASRRVVVVGGGDAAVEAALLLAVQQHATRVVLVHRRNEFRASAVAALQTLRQLPNVEIVTPFRVIQYETRTTTTRYHNNANPKEQLELTGVTVEHVETKTTTTIPSDGVFVMIGSTPNTQLVQGLVDLDPINGLVVTSSSVKVDGGVMMTATSLPGIFAAGQVTDDRYKQAITASAEGAQAALDAERWLRQQQSSTTLIRHGRNKHVAPVPLETIKMPTMENSDNIERREGEKALPGAQHESTSTTKSAALPDDCNDLTQQECITKLVKTYPVVVFSKPWCGYCRRALEKLAVEGVSTEPYLHVVDLATISNFRVIQNTLFVMTGRRTVPNVFVGGTSIGGGDETVALSREGKLRPLLEEAGALPNKHEHGQQVIPREGQSQRIERVLGKSPKEPTATSADAADCGDLTRQECIMLLVKAYPVVVFSISWCNKCHRALEKLAIEGVSREPHLHVVNLDTTANNHAIQDTLLDMTGRRGVPYIFIGGAIIGDGDELTALSRDGRLRSSLEAAGALPGGAELCNLTEEACIAFVVQKYPVVVFSKHYCPYCKRALEALKLEGLTREPSLRVIDLTKLKDGANVQNTLQKMTGRRTVPNVFVGGTSIGGGDETSALHRAGKLKPLLDEARAFEKTDALMR